MSQKHAPTDPFALFNEFVYESGLDRFTKIFTRYELFKRTVQLPGDIVECGVCKGAGMMLWAKLIEIFNPLSTKKVVGFDLFADDPEPMKYEWDKLALREEMKKFDPSVITDAAARQGLQKRVQVHAGDACLTIPQYVQNNPGGRISLLNLDFDNYDPTMAALEALFPRVVPGGVIIFDDYAIDHWGESIAVDEYFAGKGYVFESFPWALSPKAFAVKKPS